MGQFIIREHVYKNITGSILTIGRQTVHITPYLLNLFLTQQGLKPPSPDKVKLDASTTNARMGPFIDDRTFFGSFSSATLHALDHSDFEGADIIHNLNDPIPPELENRFDFIYNGSCLDNVWDPGVTMRNMSRMLKPGGRIVHGEHGTRVNGPYLTYPPDWFHDYYTINNYADVKTYIAVFSAADSWDKPANWIQWDPLRIENQQIVIDGVFRCPNADFYNVCLAEKGPDSTWDKCPNQFQYRSEKDRFFHAQQALKYRASSRPIIRFVTANPPSPQ